MSDLVNVAEQNRLIAQKSQQIVESTREDIQILVRQIDQLPKVVGQEWEHDPVVYVDDGLTAPFPVPIRFCHNKTVGSLQQPPWSLKPILIVEIGVYNGLEQHVYVT